MNLLQVLMERDGLSEKEAKEQIKEARRRVWEDGEDPEEVLYQDFGLEPDYVFDLTYDVPLKTKLAVVEDAYIGTVNGVRYYEHVEHGDESPLVAVDQRGRVYISDHWELPND